MVFSIGKTYGHLSCAIEIKQKFPAQWDVELVVKGVRRPRQIRRVSIANFSNVLNTQQFAIALDGLRKWSVESIRGELAKLSFAPDDPWEAVTPAEVAKWLVCLSEDHKLIDILVKKGEIHLEHFFLQPSEQHLYFVIPLVTCEVFTSDILKAYHQLYLDTRSDVFFLNLAKTIRQAPKPVTSELEHLFHSTTLARAEPRNRLVVFAAILDHLVDFGSKSVLFLQIAENLKKLPPFQNLYERYWLEHCFAAILYFQEEREPVWYWLVREMETRVLLKCFYEAEDIPLQAIDWHIFYRARELFREAPNYTNPQYMDWLQTTLKSFIPESSIDEKVYMEKYAIE